MNPITTTKDAISENAPLAKQYAQQEIDYAKFKLFYQVTDAASSLTKKLVIGTFMLIALIFASLGAALYLGELFDQLSVGFLLVTALYLLLVVVAWLVRSGIEKYVINRIAKKYF